MWQRLGQRFGKSFWTKLATTSTSTCLAATIMTNASLDKSQRIESNRILSDKHRVALAGWPIHLGKGSPINDERVDTLRHLAAYLKESGYDGIEMALELFEKMYFQNTEISKEEKISIIREAFLNEGVEIFGCLMHSRDNDWNEENVENYLSSLKKELYYNKQLGSEYVTFQIWLPDKYIQGDGSYRNDDKLINQYIERIKILQNIVYDQGLNFYVETHVGRITEDPEAFNKLLNKYNNFELNGDLSHYICRGMLKGEYINNILNKVEHTHVRMARVYGDLSVNIDNPIDDWNNGGVTKEYWNFAKDGFKNGLSSRVIVGESGPMHLVNDALKQDQKMVPLLRAFANYCDKQTEMDDTKYNPFDATAHQSL